MAAGKLRWGVIGSGGIARRRTIPEGLVPASNAVLVAVQDIDRAANEAVARQFGVEAAGSIEDLLRSEIDTVYVATPADLHRDHVVDCAEAGKHVLCEKPLGLTSSDAEEAAAACAFNGVRLGIGFMMRFQAQHRAARDLIREGRIGKPVYGRAQLSCWYPPIPGAWRQDPARGGGGSLMDMGGHTIDLLEMLLGPVREVSCSVRSAVHGYASEDGAVASLAFESGALGTVDAFFSIPDEASGNVLEVYGSAGSIIARGTIGQGARGEMRARFARPGAAYSAQQAREAAEGVAVDPEPINPYRAEVEDFGRAVLEEREPEVGAEAGIRSSRIIDACYRSAREGRAIKV
jgi:predicted dehydrogenase